MCFELNQEKGCGLIMCCWCYLIGTSLHYRDKDSNNRCSGTPGSEGIGILNIVCYSKSTTQILCGG